jgi:hypothetical protein
MPVGGVSSPAGVAPGTGVRVGADTGVGVASPLGVGVPTTTLVGVAVGKDVLVGDGAAVGVNVNVGVASATAGNVGVAVGRAACWARLMLPKITTPPMANSPSTNNPTRNRAISTKSLLLPVITLLLSLEWRIIANGKWQMADNRYPLSISRQPLATSYFDNVMLRQCSTFSQCHSER